MSVIWVCILKSVTIYGVTTHFKYIPRHDFSPSVIIYNGEKITNDLDAIITTIH